MLTNAPSFRCGNESRSVSRCRTLYDFERHSRRYVGGSTKRRTPLPKRTVVILRSHSRLADSRKESRHCVCRCTASTTFPVRRLFFAEGGAQSHVGMRLAPAKFTTILSKRNRRPSAAF